MSSSDPNIVPRTSFLDPLASNLEPRSSNPKTLRILMLAPTPYFADRGCHVRIYEEARVLRELGHDVRLVTYPLGRDLPGIPTYRTVRVPGYGKLAAGPSWHKPLLDILLLFKAWQVAREFRPDLLHAHLHEGAFIGAFLRRWLGVPLLFDCQGSLSTELMDHGLFRRNSLPHRAFRWLEGIINHRADRIITSSTTGARDFTAEWGIGPERVSPLIDGVNTDEFRPMERLTVREELGLPAETPVVAFLGLLNRYQGLDLLLEAIQLLAGARVAVHFLIMGFPDAAYRQRATELGIADRITFTGRVDYGQAPRFLSAADCAVSPKISLTEANGKLFNYLACGLPTVVFETPVNREILGEDGVYAAFGDAAALAMAIRQLLADPERLADLGQRSRERAVTEHAWAERGERLAGIYSQMLAGKQDGA
jgi:glycosyltransferase involved in cell wall biosynthesis